MSADRYAGECILHGDWDENYCGPECTRLTRLFYAPIEGHIGGEDE